MNEFEIYPYYADTFSDEKVQSFLLHIKVSKFKPGSDLLIACEYGMHQNIISRILENKANVNEQGGFSGCSPLQLICQYRDLHSSNLNRVMVVTSLLKAKADVNLPDIRGNTPLFEVADASWDFSIAVFHLLINAKANINHKNLDQETPLLRCISRSNCNGYGEPVLLQELLKLKADVNQSNQEGSTPLLIAVERTLLSAIPALLAAEADTKVKKNGKTVLQIAQEEVKHAKEDSRYTEEYRQRVENIERLLTGRPMISRDSTRLLELYESSNSNQASVQSMSSSSSSSSSSTSSTSSTSTSTRSSRDPKDAHLWSVEDVSEWLEREKFAHVKSKFKAENIDGAFLLSLTDEALKDLGIEKGLERSKIMRSILLLKKSI